MPELFLPRKEEQEVTQNHTEPGRTQPSPTVADSGPAAARRSLPENRERRVAQSAAEQGADDYVAEKMHAQQDA